MKKTFLGLLWIISLTCFLLVGCDNNTDDKDLDNDTNKNNTEAYENKGGVNLTGTYGRQIQSSANDTLGFSETSFSATRYSSELFSGTYKYDGTILTLTIGGAKHNYYANRTSVLTISGDGPYSFFNGTWIVKSW